MATVSNQKRERRTKSLPGLRSGEIALRARYILRAEYLCSDKKAWDFVAVIQREQREWDRVHKGWRIDFRDKPLQEWRVPYQDTNASGKSHLITMQDLLLNVLRLASNEGDDELIEIVRREIGVWCELVLSLAQRFWPSEDFPNPAGVAGNPAFAFVDACLTYHPSRLKDWVESLFPDIRPLATPEAFMSIYYDDVEPLRGAGLRYDGMSAAYLIEASAEVERIRALVHPVKTTEERARDLRMELALSQDKAAARLGVTPDAMRRISPGRVPSRNKNR